MRGIGDLVVEITPDLLLRAYACGIFPMSESADDPGLFWVEPEVRGIIPLDEFHVPRRLQRTIRKGGFEITVDNAFKQVIASCAEWTEERRDTWINNRIQELYCALHERGNCHSVEVWMDGTLAGGLYGVSLGAAFFGESMFSRRTDASKIALVHLVERLRVGGYTLLDTQFITSHLSRFGAVEIPRKAYEYLLETAIQGKADFFAVERERC